MSCRCQDCGRQYKVDLLVSDELWGMIKPQNKTNEAGLLCGCCIMNKIEMLDKHEAFLLVSK